MARIDLSRLPQYEVGGYPKDQLEKVQELFSQAFGGRTLSEEWLRWHLEKNPCLKEKAITLWQGDTLVSYCALTPFSAMLQGTEIIAALNGTMMVNDDFPGASLQTLKEIAAQNSDVKIILGFPNKNMFRISVKYFKNHYVGDIAFWMTEAREMHVSDRIHEFYEFTEEYEAVSRKLAEDHDFIKIRKRDFMNWRFFQYPGRNYRCFEYEKRGFIVVDMYMDNGIRQLQIVDILADSERIMDELLKYSINLAHELGCSVVKLWLTSKLFEEVLVKNGFIYGEHPFAMTVRDQDLNISKSYITMGDSDIF